MVTDNICAHLEKLFVVDALSKGLTDFKEYHSEQTTVVFSSDTCAVSFVKTKLAYPIQNGCTFQISDMTPWRTFHQRSLF
jgi:hypothetical protein